MQHQLHKGFETPVADWIAATRAKEIERHIDWLRSMKRSFPNYAVHYQRLIDMMEAGK